VGKRQLSALQVRQVSVTPAALVIGGGIAGIQAALDIADAGFPVTLVEKAEQLGGRAARLHRTFPTLEEVGGMISPLVQRLNEHPRLRF
jgi:heterodisulfide reductase subunit A